MQQEKPAERSFSLTGFLIDRPIGVFTVLATILVLGVIAYFKLPLQMLPAGWQQQWIRAYIPVPESNPYENLDKITRDLEEEMSTIAGIDRMTTNSSSNSVFINLRFTSNTDMDVAYGEVRDRMERLRPRLPNGVDRYFIWRNNFDESTPIMWAGMVFDLPTSDARVNDVAENIIQPALEQVDGVAKVDLFGLLGASVRILLDEDKVRAARLNLYQVIQRLQQDNFITPAGKIDDADSEYLLRVNARFNTIEDIENYPLNDRLKVKDVGEVRKVQSIRQWLNKMNGKYVISCAVYMEPGRNIVETCNRVDAAIARLEARTDLHGFEFFKNFDQGKFIKSSFAQLEDSAVYGGLLAIFILLLFLRKVRLTFLVTLAIPLSILMTLIFTYFTGGTLNLLTMMGLTLGIGMVIDNAIVVLENIKRLRALDLSRREATVRGVKEVALAITLSTLTSIVVFIPLMFLTNNPQMTLAFTVIGITLSVSIFASLLIALLFIPSVYYALNDKDHGEQRRGLFNFVPALLARSDRVIQFFLKRVLKYRAAALGVFFLLIMSLGIPMEFIGKSMAGGQNDHFHIMVDLPSNMTITEAADEMEVFESWLLKHQERIGFSDVRVWFNRQFGELEPRFDPPLSPEAFKASVDWVREKLPKRAGSIIRYRTHIAGEAGEGQEGGMSIAITGRDPDLLAELGKQIVYKVESIPEVLSATTSVERGNDEVQVVLDREKTSNLGISPQTVTGVVEWGLRGFSLPRYQDGDRQLPFIIEYAHGADESLNDLRDMRIFTPGNTEVPLSAIANFSMSKGYGNIYRRDRNTVLFVSIDSNEKDIELLSAKVAAVLGTMKFPPGYGFNTEGGFRQFRQQAGDIIGVGILAIVLVFLLMGMLFESALLPISVLGTIVFAFFGGLWFMFLTQTALDPVGMIGFVILVGIVVNNGVLLVDHINRLRRENGMDRLAAIYRGTSDRLRPILMTALTTIVGLVPMALTQINPQEGISYNTLAIAVIGGLSVSTFFTLLVVPLLYTLVEDIRANFAAAFRKALALANRPKAHGKPVVE